MLAHVKNRFRFQNDHCNFHQMTSEIMIRNIEKHIKLKHWFAFSVQILLMALTSCGLDSRKIEKVTQIEYRAKISDVPNGRVISVGAKSKSGVVVIGQVNPGMILYFKDTDDSHHRFMGLEMLLDPDVQYEIVDNEWTTIIQINSLGRSLNAGDILQDFGRSLQDLLTVPLPCRKL